MEELAADVGPDGEAAAADEGEDLAVDGKARPAQEEGGHGQLPRGGPVAGEGPYPAGELDEAGEEPLRPPGGKAQRGEQGAQQTGQTGQQPGEKEQLDDHREKDHEGADIQGGEEGVFDGAGEGGGDPLRLEGGRGPPLPAFPLPLVEAEEKPHTHRGGGVGQVEEETHPAAGKDTGSHHAQDEGGPGVVAEGQQPLRLCLGAHALLIE